MFLYHRSDLYAQLSPVCSIVGGVMAQEIIKAASQKHAPLNNLFTFNIHQRMFYLRDDDNNA